ncbi:MAG: hypothetical protein DMG14_16885 [Acidobacteria bacterium]|nr:MAG: hypothetical protein DMG14_16885 [Acidobacteriota bacterium]
MKSDHFTRYHEELLEGSYDCVDRIVVNAYFEFAQSAGGFRSWWRTLMGSDETLDRAHMERMAGWFKRRLEAYAKKNKIPFLYCDAGERKHEKAEPYVPKDPDFTGMFLVLVGRAPAPVWEVERNSKNQITNLYRKKKWPYVNHYHIHLMDPDWGHITIRICGYPPFGAQVIANGHEWVECQARKRSLPIEMEGNCFTGGSDFQALNQIAKTLRAARAVGRLTKVCDRWLYSACLCFALDSEQQERSDFKYQYAFYQLEHSRNLLFKRGTTLDEVYEKLLDRTRRALDVKTLKTIFGRKYRPHNQTKRGSMCRLEKVIERPAYNLTVFKLHFGKLTLKIYDKGDRVLRVEIVAHNVKDLRCGALVEKMPRLLKTMQEYLHNFLNIVQAAHVSFLDEGTFDDLATPSQRGTKRLAGVDFNKVRIRRVVAAVVALGPKPLVLRSPIWREKCAKSLDRNSNPTTRGVRRTIWSRSAAKPWWNVSADPPLPRHG